MPKSMRLAPWILGLLSSIATITLTNAQSALERDTKTIQVDKYSFSAQVPSNFTLEPLIVGLRGARMLTFHPGGDLFIGTSVGVVYRVPPPYRNPEIVTELDDYPHSVAFRDGQIFIARTSGLYSAPYSAGQQRVERNALSLVAAIPGGPGHNSRTIGVGPDAQIYMSLGISGNCSDEYAHPSYPQAARRGGIMRLDETTQPATWQGFASGLRNPVGFDWQPHSGIAYASNNGPDHLGFNQPRELFARLTPQSFHGMPWFQWNGEQLQRDPCIDSDPPREQADIVQPDVTFPARNAPMAVKFLKQNLFGENTAGDAIVALRGSWGTAPHGEPNGDPATRREPKLVLVRFRKDRPVRVDDLVTGFQLADGTRWLRPVGLAIGPRGDLYISADAGIYGLYRLAATQR